MLKTKRAQAFDGYKKILCAVEEHLSEAQKEGNDEWADTLQKILDGLYAAEIPTKSGRLKVTLKLGE